MITFSGQTFCEGANDNYDEVFYSNTQDRESLITMYFNRGYNNYEILGFLLACHGLSLSNSQLRRILARLGLRRRNVESNMHDILNKMRQYLSNGDINLGYRALWKKLNIFSGLRVTQSTTQVLLRFLDPDGVRRRKIHRLRRRRYTNRGPNFLIHIDGNDKLKPYGIYIHGAIDGYSRKILWLRAGYTNKNPMYILSLYLDFLLHSMKLPRSIRFDGGTENVLVRDVHLILRSVGHDISELRNCALSGRSTANQRIEMFWGILHKSCLYFWRDVLRTMRESGDFRDNDPVDIECVRFCFIPVIQHQLDEFRCAWNSHRIRSQQREEGYVTGVPDVLYFQPEAYGTFDQALPVPFPRHEIQAFAEIHSSRFPEYGCNEMFVQLIENAFQISRDQFETPVDIGDALRLFYVISNKLSQLQSAL